MRCRRWWVMGWESLSLMSSPSRGGADGERGLKCSFSVPSVLAGEQKVKGDCPHPPNLIQCGRWSVTSVNETGPCLGGSPRFVRNRDTISKQNGKSGLETPLCQGLSFAWASLVAQMVKNLPEMQETPVQSLGQEDPLEKDMAIHSSTLGLPLWLSW